MTLEALEQVLWRLRKNNPNNEHPTNKELRRAICYEIGTDMRTYHNNRKALIDMGWIKAYGRQRISLTDVDLTG